MRTEGAAAHVPCATAPSRGAWFFRGFLAVEEQMRTFQGVTLRCAATNLDNSACPDAIQASLASRAKLLRVVNAHRGDKQIVLQVRS